MTLDQIAAWFKNEPESLRTFIGFQQRCYAEISSAGDQAVYLRLLGRMAGRLADQIEGEPIAVEVVEAAHRQLAALTEQAIEASKKPAADQLAIINKLARLELQDARELA